jgi:hypothetical protein
MNRCATVQEITVRVGDFYFVPPSYPHYGTVYFRGCQFGLLDAILVSYFLTPEAVPGTFVVPLRGGFEITAAGRQVLANYVFV